ncbi:polysaccharide deacetylase family protein [Parvicella tangerina]|uniref:Peptidoglycan-N-acetylglucosamine deacetylase n=1 Tax=Parvicella tangerina TaxID=2829795 RepID=A0A916JQJ2_9FLAO|nr:polysaccharide deacetylase family protein [Parvicella tangerina]CAG5086883.1 Peptidoglycan-N-acetylglucosamine deacetylase [Parvicella tangerina]
MNYFVKTPKLLHSLYRDAVWFIPNAENKIFLTFDDGPVEGITSSCLDILATHDVKATFFCVGENIINNKSIFERIKKEGHTVGHHSYNHLKGWKTQNEVYFENVKQGANLVNTPLFRPPYGKIKRSQINHLKSAYKIIMWDVLSGDFDPKVSTDQCVKNVLKHTESGSIIVMHDNEKCGKKMLLALPEIITNLKSSGFQFSTLPI